MLIPLTKGMFATIDRADADRVAGRRWSATKSTKKWYARTSDGHSWHYLHRFLLNAPDGVEVDHADNDGLNCRRSNIREASSSQNKCNRTAQPNNTSGFKGVIWDKARKKWRAEIQFQGKSHHLGRFDTAEDAALAYDTKSRELHGDFSRTNLT
jgi:hypothetical protein